MGRKRPTTTTPGLLHSGNGRLPLPRLPLPRLPLLRPSLAPTCFILAPPTMGGFSSRGRAVSRSRSGMVLMDTRKTFNAEVVPWLQRTARICPLARKPGGDFDNAHPNRGHYRYSWPYHKTPPPENYIDSPKCGYRFIFTSAKTGWLMWREDDGGAWGEKWGG